MAMKPEKICRGEKSKHYRKWLKRCTSRVRRRIERHDPENAPNKNWYRGWSM